MEILKFLVFLTGCLSVSSFINAQVAVKGELQMSLTRDLLTLQSDYFVRIQLCSRGGDRQHRSL